MSTRLITVFHSSIKIISYIFKHEVREKYLTRWRISEGDGKALNCSRRAVEDVQPQFKRSNNKYNVYRSCRHLRMGGAKIVRKYLQLEESQMSFSPELYKVRKWVREPPTRASLNTVVGFLHVLLFFISLNRLSFKGINVQYQWILTNLPEERAA